MATKSQKVLLETSSRASGKNFKLKTSNLKLTSVSACSDRRNRVRCPKLAFVGESNFAFFERKPMDFSPKI